MNGSIRLPLGKSGDPAAWATIDLADYERLVIHRWYVSGRGYAFRTAEGRSTFMHREVLGFPESEDINHINGDPLDNRRANLEACTHRHNAQVGAKSTAFKVREEIRVLREKGWQNRKIANELGISVSSVIAYASDLPKAPAVLRWSREDLIAFIRDFYAEHGRLPRNLDLDGKDGKPWYPVMYRRFPGGVREWREAAGFGAVDLRRGTAA